MIKLFRYEGYKIIISEEALALKPFKQIWQRDRTVNKDKAIAELGFIYFSVTLEVITNILLMRMRERKLLKREKVCLPNGSLIK